MIHYLLQTFIRDLSDWDSYINLQTIQKLEIQLERRERSSSLSERHEEEEEEESEADGGGDSGVLEDVGVTSSRGRRHIVARAAQVFVTAEKIIDWLDETWWDVFTC